MGSQQIPAEVQEYITQLEDAIQDAPQQQQQQMPFNPSMFGGQAKQNLVEMQLDFSKDMEKIEHFLRCDIIIRDPQTNKPRWAANPNKNNVVFNDLGVNDLIREIMMLINKNKILSNYREEDIRQRVKMISHELRFLIYNNYERYGMDNDYKQNNYSMIVLTLDSMIEDAFRRALNGEERRDLNQARFVNQNDPVMPNGMYPQQQQRVGGLKKILPWNWGK